MTAHPIPDNHDHWWLYTDAATVLHAVPGEAATADEIHEAIDINEHLRLPAGCGRTLALSYPGVLSRLGLPRCSGCCRAAGVPEGKGAPANEKDLRNQPSNAHEGETAR